MTRACPAEEDVTVSAAAGCLLSRRTQRVDPCGSQSLRTRPAFRITNGYDTPQNGAAGQPCDAPPSGELRVILRGSSGETQGNSGELRYLEALGAGGRQAANSTKSLSANSENAKRQSGQETTSAGNSAGRSKCFIILEWEHQARGPSPRGWQHLEFYARRASWGGRGEAGRRAAAQEVDLHAPNKLRKACLDAIVQTWTMGMNGEKHHHPF